MSRSALAERDTGSFAYTVTVTDSVGATAADTSTVAVMSAPCPALSVNAPALSGVAGTGLSDSVNGSGGCPPYTFSKVSGPSWLSLSSSGTISGTPVSAGSFSYSVSVTDSRNNTAIDSDTITVSPPPPTCSALSVDVPNLSGRVGVALSDSVSATGGCPPYTFGRISSGPSWLRISSSGAISGTPTSAGSYSYSVAVADSQDNIATGSGTVTVGCPTLFASAPNLSGTRGNDIYGTAGASGGCAPYTYSKASGPSWLSVSSSGVISGAPTGSGNFPYEVRVTDSENNIAIDAGTVSVTAPPLRLSVPDIAATRNVAFSDTATASGGTPGYTYSRASGPIWLSVSRGGTVWGTPDEVGNFAYSVTVGDGAGTTRTESGTVYVSPPPLEASAPSLSGTVGTALSGNASASGARLRTPSRRVAVLAGSASPVTGRSRAHPTTTAVSATPSSRPTQQGRPTP